MLVATIEREINLIFGVRRARPIARRLLVYVLGITLGPVAAGIGISAATRLVGQSLDVLPMHESIQPWVGRPLPWIYAAAGFTLVYKIVPYLRVRWRHALAGGVLAALGFEAAKGGFAWYVANVPTYQPGVRRARGAAAVHAVALPVLAHRARGRGDRVRADAGQPQRGGDA